MRLEGAQVEANEYGIEAQCDATILIKTASSEQLIWKLEGRHVLPQSYQSYAASLVVAAWADTENPVKFFSQPMQLQHSAQEHTPDTEHQCIFDSERARDERRYSAFLSSFEGDIRQCEPIDVSLPSIVAHCIAQTCICWRAAEVEDAVAVVIYAQRHFAVQVPSLFVAISLLLRGKLHIRSTNG